jgi:hypothetical protein
MTVLGVRRGRPEESVCYPRLTEVASLASLTKGLLVVSSSPSARPPERSTTREEGDLSMLQAKRTFVAPRLVEVASLVSLTQGNGACITDTRLCN